MIKFQNSQNVPLNILNAMRYVQTRVPDALFGGSIALNALGLLDRVVKDIDVVVPEGFVLDDKAFSLRQSAIRKDYGGLGNVKTKALNVDIDFFRVDSDRLSGYNVYINGMPIKIQDVRYAILAKMSYAGKVYKHQWDLDEIHNILIGKFMERLQEERFGTAYHPFHDIFLT